MHKIGKIGKLNIKANRELKILYDKLDIRYCEVNLPGCTIDGTTWAHRHKRHWYRGRMWMLSLFNQTIKACLHYHQILEPNTVLTEKTFMELRGPELYDKEV